MASDSLFPDLATTESVAAPTQHTGAACVARADRSTSGWEMVELEQLAADQRIRPLVACVGKLELGPLYRAIKARARAGPRCH
jgi:hypothetical protein